MDVLNCTITNTDDSHLILATRGRVQRTVVIPRDKNAAKTLLDAVDAAIAANQPPSRPVAPPVAK